MFNRTTGTEKLAKRAQALQAHMSDRQKSALAFEIGSTFNQPELSEVERNLAEEIIRFLIQDEIDEVRIAIAKAVADSPFLSKDLAQQLAEDINEVALPVLELSPVLEEKMLEKVIASGVPQKIWAIAGRDDLSENLCRRVVASGRTPAVVKLLKNQTSNITNQTLITIVRVYGDDLNVENAMFNRGEIPQDVIETLHDLAEEHVAKFITRYFELPDKLIANTSEPAEEKKSSWWDSSKKGAV